MNRIKKWLIYKLGGVVIEPLNYHYLVTAVNHKGETIPWTKMNPNKRKSKHNMVECYNFYENDNLKITFPIK
jgi:hypothetical protein